MKKKPLIVRVKNTITRKLDNFKHRNTKWCFDESECVNETKNCKTCSYHIDFQVK